MRADEWIVDLPLPWGHCEKRGCAAIGVMYLDREHEGVWCNLHRWVRCGYTRGGWPCNVRTDHEPFCERHTRARLR